MSGKNAAKFWNFSCLHNIKANENLWHFLFSAAVVKSTSVNNKLIVSTVKGFVVLSALLVIGKFYLDELLCLACVCLQYNLHNPSTWLILFFFIFFIPTIFSSCIDSGWLFFIAINQIVYVSAIYFEFLDFFRFFQNNFLACEYLLA